MIQITDWNYSDTNFRLKKIKIRPVWSILYSEIECYFDNESEGVYRIYPKDSKINLGVSLFNFNPKTQSYFPKTSF